MDEPMEEGSASFNGAADAKDDRRHSSQLMSRGHSLLSHARTGALRWLGTPGGLSRRGGAVNSLRTGAMLVFATQAAATGVRYVVQVLFARAGGVRSFGYFSFAFSWINLLTLPVALGFTVGVLRFVPTYMIGENWSRLRALLRFSLHVTVSIAAATAAVGTAITLLSGVTGAKEYTLIVGFWLLVPISMVNINKQNIRASLDVLRAYGLGELLPPTLTVAAIVPFLVTHRRLSSVTMLTLLGGGFAVVIPLQLWSLRKLYPHAYRRIRPDYDRRYWLSVSMPMLAVVALQGTINNIDTLLVGFLRGPVDTGLYAAANRLATQTGFILTAVGAVVTPTIARHHAKGDDAALERTLHSAVRWCFWPTLGVTIPLLLASGPILGLFGPRFVAASQSLRVLAIAGFFAAISGPVGVSLAMTGNQRILGEVSVVALIIGALLELVLIPTLGIVGAAIGDAVQTILWNGWLYIFVRRRLGIRLYGFV